MFKVIGIFLAYPFVQAVSGLREIPMIMKAKISISDMEDTLFTMFFASVFARAFTASCQLLVLIFTPTILGLGFGIGLGVSILIGLGAFIVTGWSFGILFEMLSTLFYNSRRMRELISGLEKFFEIVTGGMKEEKEEKEKFSVN